MRIGVITVHSHSVCVWCVRVYLARQALLAWLKLATAIGNMLRVLHDSASLLKGLVVHDATVSYVSGIALSRAHLRFISSLHIHTSTIVQ